MKIYGPYTRPDGRKQMVIKRDNGSKTTQSYPRFLMEKHLGRKLLDSEHVDHINEDKTDNRLENLQLLSPSENSSKTKKNTGRYFSFNCPVCDIEFQIEARRFRDNQIKQGKAGPYCSKSCAGKMHH